jgi:general secretion pathway protein M
MKALQGWWRGLVQREKLLVLLGGGALLACLYYLLVLEPLTQRVERLAKSVRAESETLTWLEAQRAVAQGPGGAATPVVDDGRSLLAIINDAASAHGIAAGLKRVTPLSERNLTLGFEDVAYAGVMQWLQEMVAQRGARIERLNMERRDKPGIVTTEMTLTFP